MTNRQAAWRKIGVAFETEPEKRTEEQRAIGEGGLCCAIQEHYPVLDRGDVVTTMNTVANNPPCNKWGFWWPNRGVMNISFRPTPYADWTRQCDYERSVFAYFMAAIGDNDYKEMVR